MRFVVCESDSQHFDLFFELGQLLDHLLQVGWGLSPGVGVLGLGARRLLDGDSHVVQEGHLGEGLDLF